VRAEGSTFDMAMLLLDEGVTRSPSSKTTKLVQSWRRETCVSRIHSDALGPTDSELLAAWRTGQNRAGAQLLARHRYSLRRFLRRHAGELAEDLLQETLLVGVRHRDSFQGQSSFRTYLFGIAKKLLRRLLEREERLLTTYSLGDDELSTSGATTDNRHEYELLIEAVQRLRAEERLIVQRYFWDDLTAAEIAQRLGVSERAIRSRLRRVLTRLRKSLASSAECAADYR
jgi:RNA polymerase sigma factor (sigma-70 family)